MNKILIGLSLFLASSCSGDATKAADNTGRNVRDRGGDTATPTDQSESKADLTITQDVRQALMEDDTLGFDAKNVKVITESGKVTLRGPVESAAEKQAIEAKVRAIAGVMTVDNQLEIKTD
jgi:osmotically-inducible protein OsmY